jgi:UDPglucose 6-dehydrogenase
LGKKIGIVGHGYVGKIMEKLFKDHFPVEIHDPKYNITDSKAKVNECDLAIICVPTPMKESGDVDLSHVLEVFTWLKTPLILIKSTVLPGTTEILSNMCRTKYAFSPEYVGEGKYVTQWWKDKGYPHPTDVKFHDFQIFGGDRDVTSRIIEFFKVVLGPEHKYIQTDSKTAELVKYMQNSWGSMKVTFCNEFAKIAETLGVDYNELRELWLLDGRTERMHTLVYKDNGGFGGKCLPKDVNGIVTHCIHKGYTPELLQQVLKSNEVFSDK